MKFAQIDWLTSMEEILCLLLYEIGQLARNTKKNQNWWPVWNIWWALIVSSLVISTKIFKKSSVPFGRNSVFATGQFWYFDIPLQTIELSLRLQGIYPTDTVVYSQGPPAEVCCLQVNYETSKLPYCMYVQYVCTSTQQLDVEQYLILILIPSQSLLLFIWYLASYHCDIFSLHTLKKGR